MQMVLDFIEQYLKEELIVIFGTIATIIANAIKNKYDEYINAKLEEKIEKTKEEIVIKCVNAVEQAYKDMTGEEKFQKVVEFVDTLLAEKGITITEVEIKVIIESAVHSMNVIKKEIKEGQKQEQTVDEILAEVETLTKDSETAKVFAKSKREKK